MITGMTLRDWFAGQAIAGMMAYPGNRTTAITLAEIAYEMADAMIATRNMHLLANMDLPTALQPIGAKAGDKA